MKTYNHLILALFAVSLIFTSCVSRKKLTYLQYSDRSSRYDASIGDGRTSVTPSAYRIMPYDNLYIRVITPDPQWSALFNVDIGSGGLTQESAALAGYPVDNDGNIEIPFVGEINVRGKTLPEIKTELDSIFKNYVADAAITVRLVNNYISIIGEVRGPGRYVLTKDRINIFEALSESGDITEYGMRQRIQLIRPSPYGPVIKEFSLSDRSILNSEFYYILPNDIIYVMPMKGRTFSLNSSVWSLVLTSLTSSLAIIAFFRTL